MIKKFKPTTPTRRHTVLIKDDKLSSNLENTRSLITNLNYKAGRNAGKISVRHKGGRVKRQYRIIDFKRDKFDIVGVVEELHYDPCRSANIALIKYSDGERRYILATKNMEIGQKVVSGEDVVFEEGNSMPITKIPSGSFIHNIELKKGAGGILGRSAGVSVQKQGNVKDYVQVKMPSGEVRLIKGDCYATLGEIGNDSHNLTKIGKAGRKRKMGIRPTVRGVAMSWKHPHSGGQGKSGRVGTGGPAKTPWGKKQNVKTRKNKLTNKFIVQIRTTKRRPNVKHYKTIV